MSNLFSSATGSFITIEEARSMVGSYTSATNHLPNVVKSHFFGKDKLLQLLSQKDCAGLHIHYGTSNDQPKLIIVASTEDGTELLSEDGESRILDYSQPCPPICRTMVLGE